MSVEITKDDFQSLAFLAGRWRGEMPGGGPFFEEYVFVDPGTLEARRFADSSFREVQDRSVVKLEDGQVVCTWGEFRWIATALEPDRIRFSPMPGTPSSFSWHRSGADSLEVTQQWTDERGEPQQMTMVLSALR